MKVGDVVWLISGGLAMTVLETGGGLNSNKVTCGYFDDSDNFHEVVITEKALTDKPDRAVAPKKAK